MNVLARILIWALLSAAVPSFADIVVLHDGTSYSGHYAPAGNGNLSFTDNQGIHYDIPVGDVAVAGVLQRGRPPHATQWKDVFRPVEWSRNDSIRG